MEKAAHPESIDTDREFWTLLSQLSLEAVWGDDVDDLYGELLIRPEREQA